MFTGLIGIVVNRITRSHMKVTIDVEDYKVIPTTNIEDDCLRELLIERLGANQLHLCPPAPDTAVSALEPETSRCRQVTARTY